MILISSELTGMQGKYVTRHTQTIPLSFVM